MTGRKTKASVGSVRLSRKSCLSKSEYSHRLANVSGKLIARFWARGACAVIVARNTSAVHVLFAETRSARIH
eukprot:1701047-Pleurochrysis_carterae.AAC.2